MLKVVFGEGRVRFSLRVNREVDEPVVSLLFAVM